MADMLRGGLNRRPALYLASAVVLLAFGLRLVRLDFQSLWYDEGATWYVAAGPWGEMFSRLARMDAHPPLYYALLKVWMALAGSQHDLLLRFPAVLFGVLTVAIVYALGWRLLRDRPAALAAALVLALSAQHVVFSQEVRMYSAAVFLGGLATLFLVRWINQGQGGRGIARPYTFPPHAGEGRGEAAAPAPYQLIPYALAASALLYTNYFGLLVIIFHGAVVLAALLARRIPWRSGGWWSAAQVAAAASLLPIAGLIRSTFGYNFVWRPFLSLPDIFVDAWWALTAASPLPRWQPAPSALALGALLLFGLFAAWRRDWLSGLTLGLYLALPVTVLGLLAQWRPVYVGRYLLYSLVPLALLAGAGLAGLARRLGRLPRLGRASKPFGIASGLALAALAFGIPSSTALRAYYFDPRFAREDFRAVAAHIQSQERPGDALILLNAAYPFLRYYSGALPHVILPPNPDRVESEAEVLRALNGLPPFTRAWLVAWQWEIADPEQFIETQLRLRGSEVGEQRWGTESVRPPIRAAAYALAGGEFEPEPARPLDVRFGADGALRLRGYNLSGRLAPGQRAFLSLWWALDGAPPPGGTVFVHVLAGEALAAGQDKRPLNDYYPLRVWTPGRRMHDVYVLDFPAGAPPPPYTLEVGVYDAQTLQRWPALGQPLGDRIQIEP